jgi:alpha-L-rhamnosidase
MNEINRRIVLGGMAAAATVTALPIKALADGGGMRPVRLTTEHVINPLGIESAQPRFGWQLEGTGQRQRAYRIRVADVWDSGRIESAEQTAQVYAGPSLQPKTRYHWTVQVWDENDRPGPVSEPDWFETALHDWEAQWVGSGVVVPPPVRVLGPNEYKPVPLGPGETLGQDFVSPSRMVALTVLLKVKGTAGCVMTLRRDGEVVHVQVLSGLTADRYGDAQGRLDFPQVLEPGSYRVELSQPRGEVAWQGIPGQGLWVYSIPPDPPADPLLRTEFDVPTDVVRARLYISGLGQARAWVNGQRVGDTVLMPSTDYDRKILYTVHDVTSLVRQGKNAIGVALGRGWFATRAPDTDGSNLARWVAEPQLKAQLEVTTKDGRSRTVATGPEWRMTEGPTVFDGLYTGETYDARRAIEGWTEPGFDARGWRPVTVVPSPGGRMTAYTAEPIRTGQAIRPVKVTQVDGVWVYDFGVVLAGWARLRGRFARGTPVRMIYSEKLGANGRINVGTPGGNENNSVDGRFHTDEYIAAGRGVETWEASFTYKGFRYLEANRPLDVVAVPVESAVQATMDIKLDDPGLQWIADAFKQTARNTLRGHPDISPMFNKMGWTSGTYRSAQPMLYQFGVAAFYDKWLADLRASQAPDGEIALISPQGEPLGGWVVFPSSTGVYPYLVRRYWLTYGDKTVPEKHFDGIRRYVEWLLGKMPDGVIDDQFGDWYPPGKDPRAPEKGKLVGTAYAIQTLRDAAAIAELLGRAELAKAWRAKEADITRRFNEVFLDAGAAVYRTDEPVGYRQTSNAVPLEFGLVPAKLVDAVAANLVADVEARGRHLNTGALGTSSLPFALSDNGRADLATAVLSQRTYPSYGYLREQGATTFWESWEADSRGHQDPTLSTPVRWLVERAAGVEVVEAGWARFRVSPRGGLSGAKVVFDTVRGRVEVAWRRAGKLVVDVRVPVNAVAEVVLPDGSVRELGAGRHRVVG